LARVEQVKRFRVLPTFREPGGDEVTLTMKLKRRPIAMRYAAETDRLYEPEIGKSAHEPKVAAQQPI
jgi:long-subunit acyl-CoA synthetase (AMP-forming)